MWLGSSDAAAVTNASSCSSDSTPSLGISIRQVCSPKKTKKGGGGKEGCSGSGLKGPWIGRDWGMGLGL